jgi:hypothetical protein
MGFTSGQATTDSLIALELITNMAHEFAFFFHPF